MTFLQPYILWGLPLILLPVIIHLINRMRHRPQPWAAMMFLVAATRASTNRARLKQWLVLLFRCLAVTALVFFLARPLGGGWLGWAVNAAPDVIFIVLDRSASMETRLPGQTLTRREQALNMIAEAAEKFSETSHLVLLDSATRQAQQIASASALKEASLTGPTDTAADLPALLQIAHKWLLDNQAGATEIWIASDLQASNWHPDDDRWEALAAQYADLLQPVRFRLLSFRTEPDLNRAISLAGFDRPAAHPERLQLDLTLTTTRPSAERFPVKLRVGEAVQQSELAVNAASLRWQQEFTLPGETARPAGSASLPADANERDNTVFFVAEKPGNGHALLVSDQPDRVSFLLLAAMNPEEKKPGRAVKPAEFPTTDLSRVALILWQAPLPADPERLARFVRDGGAALFLPTTEPGATGRFAAAAFEDRIDAPEQPLTVKKWNEQDGPLALTEEGLSLPVSRLRVNRLRVINTTDTILATLDDGRPFLTRGHLGRGAYFHLATLPVPEWSNLDRGDVLVPMLQRMLKAGSRRLGQETMLACGELSAADRARSWTPLNDRPDADIHLHARLYRSGERVVAVNRPSVEDEPELITPDAAAALFGELPVRLSEQTGVAESALQGEVWRLFLMGMLAFLIIESWLVLPPSGDAGQGNLEASRKRMANENV